MSAVYETTTDAAAVIRAEYKKRGWSSRQISVRSDYYSMGSSIHVVVKDVSIPLSVAKEIAEGKERIDRDQWGEILSGGNRYVSVRYSHEVQETLTRRWAGQVADAAAKVEPGSGVLEPIAGTPFFVGRRSEYGIQLWGETSFIRDGSTPDDLAYTVAMKMAEDAS